MAKKSFFFFGQSIIIIIILLFWFLRTANQNQTVTTNRTLLWNNLKARCKIHFSENEDALSENMILYF